MVKLSKGNRTYLNATVRWTVARFRLDGIDTLIKSIPLGSTIKISRPNRVAYFYANGV